MKTLIITILVFLHTSLLFGQDLFPHIGYTLKEIKEDCPTCVFKRSVVTKGIIYYTNFNNGRMIFLFEKEGAENIECYLVPKNESILNEMINFYNTNTVVISKTEWRFYSGENGTITNVYLKKGDDMSGMKMVFMYENTIFK